MIDVDRDAALQELISRLTAMVAEAQVLTTAALRFDLESLAEARDRLARMAADPALELGRTNEVYAALRRAVMARPPVRPLAATPARSSVVASLPAPGGGGEERPPPAFAEAVAGRPWSLVEAFPIPNPPQPRSPSPTAR